jgi:curved DNA-binding protein
MNYYDTLGLQMGAAPEEIKAAYRKLAKQHHPDSGGDVSKFQEVSNAYETLSDPNKRAQYDFQVNQPQGQPGFTFNFSHGDPMADIHNHFSQMFGFNFTNAQQVPRNRNIRVQLDLDFIETLNPCQKTIDYNLSNGRETITLDIPAGIQDQSVFNVAGRGDNGNQQVPRGNLEVIIRVKPHPKFTRLDDHVFTEITIDCFQAILGHEMDIMTPRGRSIRLFIPAGTQHGAQMGITDEGFTRANRTVGKLIVKINILIPSALTSSQLNLVQQINSIRPVNT